MRAIEKRIAAVEDQRGSKDGSSSLRVFLPGRDGDLAAFPQRFRGEGGDAKLIIVRFVRPGDVERGPASVH